MTTPSPNFGHLRSMTDERGTFEHAHHREAKPWHGYCTDDMARVLLVASRQPDPPAEVVDLVERSLHFLGDAVAADGAVRNRLDQHGRWEDGPTVEDCWGRALWGLGEATARAPDAGARRRARRLFDDAARRRSPWTHARAFAALGAAEALTADPDHGAAEALLSDVADGFAEPRADRSWPWPHERLAYANASLAEARLAAGVVLDRPSLRDQGLELLAWLLDRETVDGHLSVTPVGGAGPGDPPGRFDQQPIEVAAMADACARAAAVDGDRRWFDGVAAAVAWFEGDNDAGQVMWDRESGGSYDGLKPGSVNPNEGTESTLALLSTLQHGRRLTAVAG
jgi:hypothetical protein